MKMKIDAKFEEKLTCCFKIDLRNLTNFREAMFDGIEYWCKIWRTTDLCFQKWNEEFGKFSQTEKLQFNLRK